MGFTPFTTDVDVRSSVAVTPTISLQVGGASTTVTVTGGDLVENDSSLHTDVDRAQMEELPLESQSSSVSSLVTLSSPGVSADSNGLFHGLGDHASNSFSVDGQPITDQQSKVFSNQIPSNSIQSIQVIAGAPPAEFGDKTSLVIQVTTRSGQGLKAVSYTHLDVYKRQRYGCRWVVRSPRSTPAWRGAPPYPRWRRPGLDSPRGNRPAA